MQITQVSGVFNLTLPAEINNVNTNIIYLECDTSVAPVTINLPRIADLNRFWYFTIVVNDDAGNAAAQNITIVADNTDPDLINSGANVVLNTNGQAAELYIVGDNEWKANVNA